METDILKQIAIEIFGTTDGIKLQLPHRGEKIQEAMEASFKAGIKEVVEWINARNKLGYLSHCGFELAWKSKLKEWDIEWP